MRLVIYTHVFAPKVGGVETIAQALAEGLAKSSAASPPIEVTIATATPAGEMDDRTLPFQVVRQPGLLELCRLLRKADLVHLAGPALLPLAICVLLRKPVVIEHHGFQAACPNGQLFYEPTESPCPGHFMAGRHRECLRCNAGHGRLRSLRMWLATFPRRWLCRRADVNIVPTDSLGNRLLLPRTRTVHHGLPFPPGPATEAHASLQGVFAFIGRAVTTKGLGVLLEAVRILQRAGCPVKVRVVGDGPQLAQLRASARAWHLEDRVAFLGCLPPDGKERALSEASAVVVPSLGGEVFGLAALEGMLAGRAVIHSDLGPLNEVVGASGLRFPAGDSAALASCMKMVSSSPELATERGSSAQRRAREHFAAAQMVERHLRLYQEVLGSRARSSRATRSGGAR